MHIKWIACILNLSLVAISVAAPATQPAVAVGDEAFDAALTKARDVEGAGRQQTLAAVSSRFQSVDVSTTPGRNVWSIRTLNERGKQMDAVRFTVPDGTNTHFYWAFSVANLDSWYIVPVQGELKGFEDFYPGLKFRLPAVFNQNLVLQDLPTRLTAGEEYILWFKFSKPGPEQAYLSIVLLDDDKRKVKAEDIQAAVGMRKQVGK